jgi:hypothetical protein
MFDRHLVKLFVNKCFSQVQNSEQKKSEFDLESWESKVRGRPDLIRETSPEFIAKILFNWELRPKQKEIFSYVVNAFVNLKENELHQIQIIGAYGVGKTTLEAMLIITTLYLAGLMTMEKVGLKGRLVSGSQHQVTSVMWEEIKLVLSNSNIADKFIALSKSLTLISNQHMKVEQLIWSKVEGKEQSKTGVHSNTVTVFFDEGTAIPTAAYRTVENYFSGRDQSGIWIVTGNANKIGCEFHSITELDSWKTFKWTRFCDLQEGQEDPYANRIKDRYGEDSDEYRVGVLAEFSQTDGAGLIPQYYLNLSRERPYNATSRPIYMGVDISRGGNKGDYSVICIRNNNCVIEWFRDKVDRMDLKEICARFIQHYNPRMVVFDDASVGFGLCQELKVRYKTPQRDFIEFISAQKPKFNPAVLNRRAEVALLAADWIRDTGHIASHPVFEEECSWVQLIKSENGGRLMLTSKNEMKRSTDMLDAFTMTFAMTYSDEEKRIVYNNPFFDIQRKQNNARITF